MALVMTCFRAPGAADNGPPRDAENRQVIRLRSAAGEDDLPRIAADARGDFPARALQPLLGGLPEMVDTGRVAADFDQSRGRGRAAPPARPAWSRCDRSKSAAF